jgi:NDP-sugar pyrophosphorylase family protein
MGNPTLLVLAAGMGSRYGGLKQLEPVGQSGETIIDYSIFDARRAGFEQIVFVIRKEIEEVFKSTIGVRFEKRIAVKYVFQELGKLAPGFALPEGRTKPWGTTHAILMAANVIDEPFAVINADDFYGEESYRVLAGHLKSGTPDDAMVGFILRNTLSDFGTVSRGVCHVDERGCLKDISELTGIEQAGAHVIARDAEGRERKLTGGEVVSMNMWGFTPQIFAQLDAYFQEFLNNHASELKSECYIPTAVNNLICTGKVKVKVLSSRDAWFGVTYRDDHPRVVASINHLIENGIYPRRLWT